MTFLCKSRPSVPGGPPLKKNRRRGAWTGYLYLAAGGIRNDKISFLLFTESVPTGNEESTGDDNTKLDVQCIPEGIHVYTPIPPTLPNQEKRKKKSLVVAMVCGHQGVVRAGEYVQKTHQLPSKRVFCFLFIYP